MSNGDKRPPTKLPLIGSVIEAFELTSANLADLAKLMWVWLIILVGLQAVTYWLIWPIELASRSNPNEVSLLPFLIPTVASTLIGTSIAVGWHRRLLINESVTSSHNLRLDTTVWHYFLWAFTLVAFCFAPIFLFVEFMASIPTDTESEAELFELFAFLFLILSACVIWFVTPRFAVVLPNIALGHKISVSEIWKRTRGNTWRIFSGTLLTILPFLVVILAAYNFSGFSLEPATRLAFVIQNCATETVALLTGMFSVSFLSIAYRHFFAPFNTNGTDS